MDVITGGTGRGAFESFSVVLGSSCAVTRAVLNAADRSNRRRTRIAMSSNLSSSLGYLDAALDAVTNVSRPCDGIGHPTRVTCRKRRLFGDLGLVRHLARGGASRVDRYLVEDVCQGMIALCSIGHHKRLRMPEHSALDLRFVDAIRRCGKLAVFVRPCSHPGSTGQFALSRVFTNHLFGTAIRYIQIV